MQKNFMGEDKPRRIRGIKVNPYTGYSSAIVADETESTQPVDVFSDRGRPRIVRQKLFPKDAPPKTIYLPYLPAKRELGRYVEAEGTGFGIIKMVRAQYGRLNIPNWLIPLEKDMLEVIMDLQTVLATVSDPCALVDHVYQLITNGLQVEVTKAEIGKVLIHVPYDPSKGASFTHFMFFMGNFEEAKKRVQQAHIEGLGNGLSCDRPSKNDEPEQEEDYNDADEKVYSHREQVFYSGLLLIEMYNTIEHVEALYFGSHIPASAAAQAKQDATFGRTASQLGIKKSGVSEWNRVLPPISKKSPYAAPLSFVTSRYVVQKPNAEQLGRRRTLTRLQPLHMVIEPPKEEDEPARITVNYNRIKQALKYLAGTGDCVAMLPDVHQIIHLSDTFVKKLEEETISTGPAPPEKKLTWQNDFREWVPLKPKPLSLPSAVPQQVTKLPPMIKFTDAIILRDILEHIQDLHWGYVNRKKAPTFEQSYKYWFGKLVTFTHQ